MTRDAADARRKVMMLRSGFALSLLTLGAVHITAARPQAQEQSGLAEKRASQDERSKNAKTTNASSNLGDADDVQFDGASAPMGLAGLSRRFLTDQKEIWTSPAKMRLSDTQWLVPVAGLTAGLITTDASFSRHLSHNPSTLSHYNNLSNVSVAALVGGAGSMWLLSYATHNEHWRETGFLAGEAAINSLVAVEALKYSLRRARPFQDNGNGSFFQSGGTSFPSEHAAAAWSVAGVVAHEYPGLLPKVAAYGLASLASFSRVRAQKHFPSDVLVGTLIGNLVAQNIYSRHHDPELGGEAWRSISQVFRGDGNSSTPNQGSPYVPLDSWIYAAFDRLMALGLIDTGFAGMRPWTRNECVRLLSEAAERVEVGGIGGLQAESIYRLLESEFRDDMERISDGGRLHAQVESIYSRVTGISGQPLVDGNHFGQTLINDFGRPYQEGFNTVDGISAWATSGHWATYVRAEYQHAPSAPPQSLATRQFIASVDQIPGVPPATPFSTVNRIRLLDAYVGLTFENWQVSFGKQSLWWSPIEGGPFMFSDNAVPVNMFRISRVSPFKLPSVLGWLGPIRVEWFLGQFDGHQFVQRVDTGVVGQFGRPLDRQPFLQGQKISLKPTPNFEFSVSTTTVFAGGPGALTWHTFLRSYTLGNTPGQSDVDNPGDRRSGVDFSYRIPGMRQWLTFYGDAFTEDEFSPLGYPRKSAIRGGIYMPRIPGVPKLDLRLEGGSTVPPDFLGCTGCFYVNNRYPDGSYANLGNLVGSWLGRASQGEQAWSTYWLSSRNKIQFTYRHQRVAGAYLPQGGTVNDGGVNADFWLGAETMLSGSVQYEKWKYPLLTPLPKSNVTTSIQLTFSPRGWDFHAH
jgi:membrane-associated phospholipid phosphatase